MNDNKHENSSDFEKKIEKGVIEIGKAIDLCVEKVNDFAKSEKGQKIKSGAKNVMVDFARSVKELGKTIKKEFENDE